MKCGVPQGSVLSPTLFTIYTNDIQQPQQNLNISFADDITQMIGYPGRSRNMLNIKTERAIKAVSGVERRVSGVERQVSGVERQVPGVERQVPGVERQAPGSWPAEAPAGDRGAPSVTTCGRVPRCPKAGVATNDTGVTPPPPPAPHQPPPPDTATSPPGHTTATLTTTRATTITAVCNTAAPGPSSASQRSLKAIVLPLSGLPAVTSTLTPTPPPPRAPPTPSHQYATAGASKVHRTDSNTAPRHAMTQRSPVGEETRPSAPA
ncbi:WAS/WASL-interacting protein family member 3-like [Scylla paramamosain]|uniref:WAS/WASL-interacting protein family member 3-like n=1 Tax=Scylla paramamosain TaxID=85552 RepID=UPI003082D30A